MTREEAKLILDAHTLSDLDATRDDRVRAAAAMMRDYESLRLWFEQRRAFDERAASAHDDIPVPAGLKERLLQQADPRATQRSGMLKVWMTVAAAVAIAGAILFKPEPSAANDQWVQASLSEIQRIEDDASYDLDVMTHDMSVVRALLAKSGSPLPGGLPKNLAPGMTVGCKMFHIDGHKATVVCFEVEPGVEAHLAVVEGVVDLSKLPSSGPLFADKGAWHTARWTGDGKAYLLATRGSAEMLRKLFA